MYDDQPTGERQVDVARSRDMTSRPNVAAGRGRLRILHVGLLLVLPLVLVGCLYQEDDAAIEPEVTELIVEDSAFTTEDLFLLAGEPADLLVTNRDSRAYRLQIDDLVVATPIPADTATEVEFTTPNPGEFEGQLLAEEGDEVLDTLRVVVRPPGGVS